jgi:hypothetical protein
MLQTENSSSWNAKTTVGQLDESSAALEAHLCNHQAFPNEVERIVLTFLAPSFTFKF